jgi:hypothetical protein
MMNPTVEGTTSDSAETQEPCEDSTDGQIVQMGTNDNDNQGLSDELSQLQTVIVTETDEDNRVENDAAIERAQLQEQLQQHMDEMYGARTGRYNMRSRWPRDYGHLHTTLASIAMTQYIMNKGIKLFKDSGIDAISKELEQLHVRQVLQPKNSTYLSETQRRDALQYLMFLKEKRDGNIKARGCADGQKQ